MEVAIGVPGSPQGLTQLSDSFSPVVINKNGTPVGNMISVDIDSSGMVNALYDNGAVKTLYQIPLIDMPNPNGLVALDSQTYQISRDSGPYFMWNAGDGPTGDLVNFAREESTTDVATELTDLIQTQRAYSSNAKVIQTVDEMLQETTNLKR
jgi:flagellar hook protein FlgE